MNLNENAFILIIIGNSEENAIHLACPSFTGALIWEDCGFELHCHNKSVLPFGVSISAYTSGPFIFPESHELVSGVYRIECSLNIPATIKIQHCVKRDIGRLIFAVSSDKCPPYKFKCLNGGKFESNFGTIDVKKFSLYSIIYEFVFGCPPEHLYSLYLYHSYRPTYHGSTCIWNLHFFAIKKTNIIEKHFNDYIAKLPELLAGIPITVEFDVEMEELNLVVKEKPDFLRVNMYSKLKLKKKEIDMYKEGRPPMCQLQVINMDPTVSMFSLFFSINGAKESHEIIAFHWPICSKTLVAIISFKKSIYMYMKLFELTLANDYIYKGYTLNLGAII